MYTSVWYEVLNYNVFNHFHNCHVLKFLEFIKNIVIAGKLKHLSTSLHQLLDSRDTKVMEETGCVSIHTNYPASHNLKWCISTESVFQVGHNCCYV